MSSTINKYFYIVLNSKFDGRIKVTYPKAETVDNRERTQHLLARGALEEVSGSQNDNLYLLKTAKVNSDYVVFNFLEASEIVSDI